MSTNFFFSTKTVHNHRDFTSNTRNKSKKERLKPGVRCKVS